MVSLYVVSFRAKDILVVCCVAATSYYNIIDKACYHAVHFHAVMFNCVVYIRLLDNIQNILSAHWDHICHHVALFGHSGQLRMTKPVQSLLISAIKHTTLHKTTWILMGRTRDKIGQLHDIYLKKGHMVMSPHFLTMLMTTIWRNCSHWRWMESTDKNSAIHSFPSHDNW